MAQLDPTPADEDVEDIDIFDMEDPDWEARCDAEAEADIAAGRFVPHEEVAKWLETWGKEPSTPMPESWLK